MKSEKGKVWLWKEGKSKRENKINLRQNNCPNELGVNVR